MRTAALAIACLVAASAIVEAAEPPFAASAPPHPVPPAFGKVKAPQNEPRGFAQDPGASPRARAEMGRPPRGRVCFNQSETREKIAAFRLADPLRALRAGRLLGEALSARLCRWRPDEFVYEVHVLRRDGRVLRVYMNAQNGEAVTGQNPSDLDKGRN